MVASTAACEVDHLDLASVLLRDMFYFIASLIKCPPQCYWLFMNLFQHFMLKASFFAQSDFDSGRTIIVTLVGSPIFPLLIWNLFNALDREV